MKVEVSADSRLAASAIEEISEKITEGLSRFRARLTRVEAHLSDINGPRGGVDRRCALEARPAGLQPLAVNHQAETDLEAVRGAVDKLTRLLTSTLDRLDDRRGPSASGLPS